MQTDAPRTMECEICDAQFTADDEATLPELVADDGRAGRFCPACRCDLVEAWPSEDCEEAELEQVAEWRARYDAPAAQEGEKANGQT